jgi:hypothetical protein
VIENDVQDDTKPFRVRSSYQVDEVATVAKARIHVQEILNAVAVIRVQVTALLEYRTEPDQS